MTQILRSIAVLTLVASVAASAAAAQATVRFGLGGTGFFNLDDDWSSDFGIIGMVGFGQEPIGFRVDASAIFNDLEGTGLNGFGNVVYGFRTAETSVVRPYVLGGAGYITNSEDFGGGDFALNGGAGLMIPREALDVFAEARFVNQFADPSISYIQASVGIGFSTGG